jgi:hypothetical protein
VNGQDIPAPQGSTDRITFTDCDVGAFEKCRSAGEPDGTIRTNLLDAALIEHGETGLGGKEPAEGAETWDEFVSAEDEPYIAEYECQRGLLLRTSGSLSCPVTPVSAMGRKSEDTCSESQGEQDLETEISENGGKTWESTGQNVLTLKQSSKTPPVQIENFTCVNTYGLGNPKIRKFLNEPKCKKYEAPNEGNFERKYNK